MNKEIKLKVPQHLRKGTLKKDEYAAIESAVKGFEYICNQLNIDEYQSIKMLDYGCGVKYTQAIIQHDIPVHSYTGVDIDEKMIAYLKTNAQNTKFAYSQVPFQNDMYNPTGIPMLPKSDLGIGDKKFNLVILLSVFTHLTPRDTRILLKILRRYIDDDGKVFFTVFINDDLKKNFKDKHPDKPLLKAVYRSDFLEEAINNADFKIEKILDKNDIFKTKKQYVIAPK